jgi:hypothetical protein
MFDTTSGDIDRIKEVTLDDSIPYDYPDGLDLKPGSDLHGRLVAALTSRARTSKSVMSRRYDRWREIDNSLTAYIPQDEEERLLLEEDPRRPVSIVVPFSYTSRETLLTYLFEALLTDPFFTYEPIGPEDRMAVILLENLIRIQAHKTRMALNLDNQYGDSIAYGIGAVTNYWDVVEGFVPRRISQDSEDRFEIGLKYEGNRLENIDPYLYLPDTSVAAHEVQKMEFVGWMTRENRMSCLKREYAQPDIFFNARYLAASDHGWTSKLVSESKVEGGKEKEDSLFDEQKQGNPVDILWQYVDLIPAEWDLGDGEIPEKWMFAVAGEVLVIAASPVGLAHEMFPVSVVAPSGDAYSSAPVSILEIVRGLQKIQDFAVNTREKNVRKSLNDMFVYNPNLISAKEIQRPDKAGGLIPLRHTAAWQKGTIDEAIKQLPVQDITQNYLGDVSFMAELMNRAIGTTDALQGVQRTKPERVSALESRNRDNSAISRLFRIARKMAYQSMMDLGHMLATNTQQLMTETSYVRLIGRMGEDLSHEFNLQPGAALPVTAKDLNIDFDVLAHDATRNTRDDPDVLIQLFQAASTNPLLMQELDLVRIFQYTMRLMGFKNFEDFRRKGPALNVQTAPDQMVQQGVEEGALKPIAGANGNGRF